MLALGAGAGFFARSADTLSDHLQDVLVLAQAHRGTSLVEILQNCIVYNDGAFGAINDKSSTADATVRLCQGEPMIFGKANDKGLVFDDVAGEFRPVAISDDCGREDLAVHDEANLARAFALARLSNPTPLGVIFRRHE